MPTRYQAVAGRGEFVKISTGTANPREAQRELPRVLAEWEKWLVEWDRLLHRVVLTKPEASRLTALWAAKAAGDLTALVRPGDPDCLFGNGPEAKIMDSMFGVDTAERLAKAAARLEEQVDEAERLGALSVSPETRHVLRETMRPVVDAAYREAGHVGEVEAWRATLAPLAHLRASLPTVTLPGAVVASVESATSQSSVITFDSLMEAWKATAVVKPRTIAEVGYTVKLLETFLGHDDAAKLTRDDLVRWQRQTKADGKVNNTWNQRLSMLRQVLRDATAHGRLPENVADNGLRLKKGDYVVDKHASCP